LSKKLFIIGKRSNLSRELSRAVKGSKLIPGEELHQLPALLAQEGRSNVVYNLYYKSAWLGRRDTPVDYARYAFQRLAEFTAICRDAQQYIDKVIFTSSSAVYGSNAWAAESDRCDITNLYASLKFASELFMREHFADTRIPLVIARVFNMYGGGDEFSVVSRIDNALSQGGEFQVFNNGRSVRDFVHVRDVVEIYQRLLDSTFSGVVNVGSGTGLSVNNLIEKAEIVFKRRLQVAYLDRNEIDRSVARIDTLLAAVGAMEFSSVDQYFQEQCAANG
jgi:nucleoside-diphosphate-sugar epimerase